MPVTPLHMGPGLAVKSIAGRHFSLMVFGFTQVLIDIEPLVGMIRDASILHGPTHTYVGAAAIAVPGVLLGRPVCQRVLDRWWREPMSPLMDWMRGPRAISWTAAITGALVGAWSHVFLDSLMHDDLRPFAPLLEGNALLHAISVDALHIACLLAGFAGAALFGARYPLKAGRTIG